MTTIPDDHLIKHFGDGGEHCETRMGETGSICCLWMPTVFLSKVPCPVDVDTVILKEQIRRPG